ncbi:MAG: pitrilysin family protein [Rhizobiaceae bacterium]
MNIVMRNPVLIVLLLLAALVPGHGYAGQAGIAADGPEIRYFKLDNGLEVVAIPDHRAPVVTHMIWYKIGAADEPRGKSGIAHFLEHLLFKGTKTVPVGEFSAKVAEIGGQENAFTSVDYTAYYQKVPPEALEMVMGYEADRMANLVLKPEDIATERDVILEERRQRVDSNPSAILGETVNAALYANHPYSIPIIGWEHEMAALTLEDAMTFYQRWYTPQNAVLIVAGDVDPQKVLELAQKSYGKIAGRGDGEKQFRPSEPNLPGTQTVTYRDRRVSVPSMRRVVATPAYVSGKAGEAEALDILASILGGAQTSRIRTALMVDNPIASSAGAWYQGGNRDYGEFGIYISPKPDVPLEQAENELLQVVEKLVVEGVTQEEVDNARESLIKAAFFERDSQTSMARLYGTVIATGGTIDDVAQWPQRLADVTVEQVNEVARKWLSGGRQVTAYLLPEAANGETRQ